MSELPPRILISAGEASGDRLGAGLARALTRLRPEIELFGMGGEQMAAAGVRLEQDASEVAVVGIFEVLAHLPAIRRAMTRLESLLERKRPDLLVPVDFPDFNLRLSARARRAGIDVVYFVSPQVWAWRKRRVHLIRRLVRRMLVLFPFESRFYENAGVPVTFVGHPVVERATHLRPREELCSLIGLDPGRPIVALLPGSRPSELGRLVDPMLEAARIIRAKRPATQFLVPIAPGIPRERLAGAIDAAGLPDVRLHEGDFPEVLSVAEAGAVASGTASLEAALVGLPMVVVYRMNALSYHIGRLLVRLDDIALPNLVAGKRVVPELIQAECSGSGIAAEVLRYLERPEEARRVREALGSIRERLGGAGAFERAATVILEELDAVRAGRGEGPMC